MAQSPTTPSRVGSPAGTPGQEETAPGGGPPGSAPGATAFGPPPEPPPAPDVEAERAEREAALAKAREETQAAIDAETFIRAAETADLRVAVEMLKEQAAHLARQRAEEPPSVRAARWGLGLTGFVQADLAFRKSSEDQLNPSTGDPLNEDRFTIRRARLKATLERTFVAGAFELDGSTARGPAARIASAEASLRLPGSGEGAPPLVMASVGLFKIPFGFEVVESDRERLFLERSTVARALFPGEYDVGARLLGGWRFIRYALAVQNGEPIGERAYPVRDPNHQKDWVGRLGVDGGEGPMSFIAGFSALYGTGFHKGVSSTKPSFQWVDGNQNGFIDTGELQPTPGRAALPSVNFSRHALGADARVSVATPVGQTTVYGELYYARDLDRAILPADPIGAAGGVGRSYRELGWYAAAMQDLGAHLTVGARYDHYNPDRDASDTQVGVVVPTNASYSTLSLCAALRSPAGRLIVQYDINRNHSGRDAVGLPTNLQDNALTVRGEARF
ncbi:MAG TPA: hypothetical protein VFH68_20905 [Polyangia bacterium]|nr:hypothetical protein [Polyangia bacterium]